MGMKITNSEMGKQIVGIEIRFKITNCRVEMGFRIVKLKLKLQKSGIKSGITNNNRRIENGI